jgi:hypothetical protein
MAMRQHFEEQGLEAPEDFFPPELHADALPYLEALTSLAGERPASLGMAGVIFGTIPYSALDRFAARAGIDEPDEFARFIRVVTALDAEEVSRLNEKANKRT